MKINNNSSKYLTVDRKLLFHQMRLLFEVLDKHEQLVNNLIVDGKSYKQSSFKVSVPEIGTFTCVRNKSSISIKLETPTRTQGLSFEELGSYFRNINLELQKCETEFNTYSDHLIYLDSKYAEEREQDLENYKQQMEDVRVEKSGVSILDRKCKTRQKKILVRIQQIRKEARFNKMLILFMNTFIVALIALSVWKIYICTLP